MSVTLHSILTGLSAISGAATRDAFSGVSPASFHLSVSLPDFTPQRSAARTSFSVVRFTTNSPVSRIIW